MKPQKATLTTDLRTDTGRVRDHNEDAVAEADELGLVVLADGMGGHNAGEVASALAISTILESMRAGWPHRGEMNQGGLSPEAALLRKSVEVAHSAILEMASSKPQCEGMGTTVVASMIYEDHLIVAYVGDSRLYRLRNSKMTQVTRDHSLVEDLIAKGFYSREEAHQNVRRNILTRALGSGDNLTVDVLDEPSEIGDIYLLCSDGLTDMVPDDEIRLTLQKFSASLNKAAERLIALANEHGGKDNVSVVLVRVDQPDPGKGVYESLKAWI